MRVRELAEWLGATFEGDGGREVTAVTTLESAGAADVGFAAGKKAELLAEASGAGCLLVAQDFTNKAGRTLIRVADPRGAVARVIQRLHPAPTHAPGVHPSATVEEDVILGKGVSVGPGASIGAGARVGVGTRVGPGCAIGEGVVLGERCLLHANVTVYTGVDVGNRVVLHSGCVLGADGFGFVLEAGRYQKFPQIGRVEIGDDVEIGANTCVDRAALGVTWIGEGAKLDNMVHIGHNCRIGRHVVIAAQTGLSGGVVVEDYAVIGGQVGIGDKARIESRAVLRSGCGVLTNKIVRSGQVVWGTPARPLRVHLEQLAHMAYVPELRRQVSELKKAVERLLLKADVE
ncbi:MAG: UDP-3-O-(3-hydroxymyristoyl)glucosamine N-acyltransferase [Acidobacteriia bacterium]|nr:UDP-3-O-(3-hydroxymyristoyl)glucosamine N-acyltransferase [Terriglobia bacterium]